MYSPGEEIVRETTPQALEEWQEISSQIKKGKIQ